MWRGSTAASSGSRRREALGSEHVWGKAFKTPPTEGRTREKDTRDCTCRTSDDKHRPNREEDVKSSGIILRGHRSRTRGVADHAVARVRGWRVRLRPSAPTDTEAIEAERCSCSRVAPPHLMVSSRHQSSGKRGRLSRSKRPCDSSVDGHRAESARPARRRSLVAASGTPGSRSRSGSRLPRAPAGCREGACRRRP